MMCGARGVAQPLSAAVRWPEHEVPASAKKVGQRIARYQVARDRTRGPIPTDKRSPPLHHFGGDAMTSIGQDDRNVVTLGVDPHPGSHTAVAMGRAGEILSDITVENSVEGVDKLEAWAEAFPRRRWAIEGAGNRFALGLVARLLVNEEEMYSIPPALTSQYRKRRTRKKNDEVDAANAARALLANPDIPRFEPGDNERKLKELTRSYRRLTHQLRDNRKSLKQMDCTEVREGLTRVVETLKATIEALKKEIDGLVKELAPDLLDIFCVGPVVAGTLLAEASNSARFKGRDSFAAYSGCAPMAWESGGPGPVRVNPGGNRAINWAIHIVVLGRLRLDERTKKYLKRKVQEGKTKREAIRCLKTFVSRELFRAIKEATPETA